MSKLQLREVQREDLPGLLNLYTQLHNNLFPGIDERISSIWEDILHDPQHHIAVGCIGDRIVVSCVIIIVKNLTQGQRCYALVENVITDAQFRKMGYATEILNFAKGIAVSSGCYKIMLMTGSKEESTLRFYERAGYNRNDKTAFIQWL